MTTVMTTALCLTVTEHSLLSPGQVKTSSTTTAEGLHTSSDPEGHAMTDTKQTVLTASVLSDAGFLPLRAW